MNITDQLIERFFQDQCNADEAGAVVAYLNEHPDILQQYLGEQAWNAYQHSERLHPIVSEKMLAAIRKSTYGEVKAIGWLRYVAAAAVLIAVTFGVYYLAGINKHSNESLANADQKIGTPVLKLIRNISKNVQEIKLSDGSLIMLEANSELQYYEPYEADKRSIFLNGEAYFMVQKDSMKPFTVHSKEISTTALGTAFSISAVDKKNIITVKLHEGKVVVRGDENAKKLDKDYFLIPGDELSYNRLTKRATVTRKLLPAGKVENKHVKTDVPSDETNWFMFNNQKLSQVLDQLSAIYNVDIRYSAAELSKMNFIGKVEKSDSIEQILNDIAILNNLTVTKTVTGYSIRKK